MLDKVEQLVTKLKNIARKSIDNKNFERAFASISATAQIFYEYNQKYVDDDLEDMVEEISKQIIDFEWDKRNNTIIKVNRKVVLFYDSFGFDTRGLVLQYVSAIVQNCSKLIYVTRKEAKDNQPILNNILSKYNVKCIYIDVTSGYVVWLHSLLKTFIEYKPDISFLYTTPSDVAGIAVFEAMENKTIRYMINLTSHAFWIGTKSCDYYIEGAERCASIAYYERKIPLEKHIEQNSYAYVDAQINFSGIPAELSGKQFIFSGGALYKTLGDEKNYFYKIVDHCLDKHKDLCFYYVGEGDTSELDKLAKKYPKRVFYEHERKDFFEVMKRCVLYLNTYPMFGGMMMRYAVYAGKIPITLRHERDADDVLLNQEKTGCVYDSYEELISDIDILLNNEDYLKSRESQVQIGVMSKSQFEYEIKNMLNGIHKTYMSLPKYDTTKFRSEYLARFNANTSFMNCIATKNNFSLVPYFPLLFIKKILLKMYIIFTRGQRK